MPVTQPRIFFLLVCVAIAAMAASWTAAAQAQSGPSPFTHGTRYDEVGRVTGTIAPDPDGGGAIRFAATRTTYDTRGNPTKVETGELSSWQSDTVAPSQWSGFVVFSTLDTTYDLRNRKTTERVTGSDGVIASLTQYSYDSRGRLECTAVRMNPSRFNNLPSSACTLGLQGTFGPDRITRNVYDAAGQLLQVREAVGTSIERADVTYSYTPNGQIRQVVDANGNRAELRYDGHDRQARWVFPSKSRPSAFNATSPAIALYTAGALNENDYEAYTYDSNGNRLTFRKRDGATLSYRYDALDRVERKTLLPTNAELAVTHRRDVVYSYDLQGRPVRTRFDSINGPGQTITYDALGRITQTSDNTSGTNRVLRYQYDSNGNRTRLTYPDGRYMMYDFDGLDRMIGLRQYTSLLEATRFDNRGQMVETSYTWRSSDHKREYAYDSAGRLSSIEFKLHGTSDDVSWTYSRNPASQILTETQSNDSYSWDGQVNLSRSYTANGLNQYTSAGGATFCYDANGNLTADGGHVYKYDLENRLVEKRAQTNTNCSALSYNGTLKAQLRYDPLGRLFYVTGGTLGTQVFLHDGNALVAEYNSSGQMLRRYVHGSNVNSDDPIVWYEGAGFGRSVGRVLHADSRGSIVAVTDDSGSVTARNSYDAYGIPDTQSGSDIATKGRFRYTGQIWIPELDMYYYKARIYSYKLGRFMQTDPIGYEDQHNLYAYVGNDPINGVDPNGLRESPAEIRLRQAEANAKASYEREIRKLRELRERQSTGSGYGSLFRWSPTGLTLLLSGSTDRTYKTIFVTYTKVNQATGQRYTGRTSIGVKREMPDAAAAELAIARRDVGHHKTKDGFGPAQLDVYSRDFSAIRGREQQRIDFFGGAQSDGGTSGNAIRAVAKPKYPPLRNAANRAFGPLPNRYGWTNRP